MIPLPTKALRWGSLGLFGIALLAATLRQPDILPTTFAPPPLPKVAVSSAEMHAELLPRAVAQAGPSSLTTLPDGRIALVWQAIPDVDSSESAIWLSILDRNGAWQAPQKAATRENTAAGTFARLNRLGRPVLWAEGSWLHLWYEALPLGESTGATIAQSVSTDGGQSWRKAERLPTNALGMLGAGLSGPPVPLADGGIGLPLERRFAGVNGTDWLRLSATGRILEKTRLTSTGEGHLAALLALDAGQALALLGTDRSQRLARLGSDGGQGWTPEPAKIPAGPDTSIALLRLPGGRLLLAGNPEAGRGTLQLWVSADHGQTWSVSRTVEESADGGAEFNDPALTLGRDGAVHLSYTWRRQAIKHVAFGEGWLDGQAP